MRTKIISIANHKGGVGKTTTTASVSSILASKGYKVLMIDLDAQANLTLSFMKSEPAVSVYDSLVYSKPLPVFHVNGNLDLIPASEALAQVDLDLAQRMAREMILKKLLNTQQGYDFIFIDCPPSLGLMTLNAFTASDFVILPIVAEVLPTKGLVRIYNFLKSVQDNLNPDVRILGILITRWEGTNLSRSVEGIVRKQFGDTVFKVKIRKNVSIAEAPNSAKNIVEYAPKSNGAADYISFTDELLERLEHTK